MDLDIFAQDHIECEVQNHLIIGRVYMIKLVPWEYNHLRIQRMY